MKRAISVMVAAFALMVVSAQAADSAQITGWISDSMCGAKHTGTGAACVKKCINGGMKPVFVDEAKKQVWSIDESLLRRQGDGDRDCRCGAEERPYRFDRRSEVGFSGEMFPGATGLATQRNLW
jgi:hypothetical protein